MSENAQVLLVIWAFWLAVIGLDVLALFGVRRSRINPTASVLWVVWIVVAPIVGALTWWIVRPTSSSATSWR
jgi:hypothetical protein